MPAWPSGDNPNIKYRGPDPEAPRPRLPSLSAIAAFHRAVFRQQMSAFARPIASGLLCIVLPNKCNHNGVICDEPPN